MENKKLVLRDKFWLWGHPEGRYNFLCGNDKSSRMTPMEGCAYLGVKKQAEPALMSHFQSVQT